MPTRNAYGTATVRSHIGGSYEVTAIDLLARGIEPRPLYSERRRMEAMAPVRLGLYLIVRAAYHRAPNWRATRWIWRHLMEAF